MYLSELLQMAVLMCKGKIKDETKVSGLEDPLVECIFWYGFRQKDYNIPFKAFLKCKKMCCVW